LQDQNSSDRWAKLKGFLLDLDSRVDNAVFHGGRLVREGYERFAVFMDRFHVAGFRRVAPSWGPAGGQEDTTGGSS